MQPRRVHLMIEVTENPHSKPRVVLDEHIAGLRARVVEMGDLVAVAVTRSVISLVDYEQRVATEVIAHAAAINALHRRVRDLALAAIVRHQPVARDLREIVDLLEMASELERMGDHAATIAGIGRTTVGVPWRDVRTDLCALADLVAAQVRDIVGAVIDRDAEAARAIAARDGQVDTLYGVVIDQLVETMGKGGHVARPATQTAFAANCLERVADRVTNIAEELVFVESGAVGDLG